MQHPAPPIPILILVKRIKPGALVAVLWLTLDEELCWFFNLTLGFRFHSGWQQFTVTLGYNGRHLRKRLHHLCTLCTELDLQTAPAGTACTLSPPLTHT